MLSEATRSFGSRARFVEKELKGTSMQEAARVAQMSVGNSDRYFPSKPVLVEALIIRHSAEIEMELETITSCPDPTAAVLAALRGRIVERHVGHRSLAGVIGSACDLDEADALRCAHADLLTAHGAMTSPPVNGWEDERITDPMLWMLDRVIHDKANGR